MFWNNGGFTMNKQTEIKLLEKELIQLKLKQIELPFQIIQFFNIGIKTTEDKIKARLIKLREHL